MSDLPSLSMKLEDYLEAIYWIVEDKRVARARDIAAALSVHKSTVTSALRSLSRKGLVNYSAYEAATLTPKGREMAEDVVRRHEIIRGFFVQVLALDDKLADANACRMEHVLDSEVLERLASFAKFVNECPGTRRECLAGFKKYLTRRPKSKTQTSKRAGPRPARKASPPVEVRNGRSETLASIK
ncbi:MAG: metal-dependent transcriptional regulator [Planctomycetes bacterium]|nr:metal-dependent transcriptional regulator [Planctomycetota bacterium]MBU4400210.1 metal-dependent transcriptional regulator [Planctomycetota bacterium]MCG2685432.1 metal-dependent transcriptional regulator [Planctomycetales bacterium]